MTPTNKCQPLEIKVERRGKLYYPEFWIENQGFQIGSGMVKVEAEWCARMLRKAFANYKKIILKDI